MRRYFKLISLIAVLALVVAACGGSGDDATDDTTDDTAGEGVNPETFYEDKIIRFITTSGPGGGTDQKTRQLAGQLQRFIPGEPATRVSNVRPHVAGMNFLWNAEPDGFTIGLTAAPTLEFEFFDEAEWDSSEWVYIGAMDAACDNVLMVKGDLGYETIEDMIGADGPTLVTITGAPTPSDVEPVALSTMLIADFLDLPLEVKRVAESGQSALNLAMERDEINFARYGSSWCILPDTHPGWLEDGYLIPILDVSTSGPGAQMARGVEERGDRPPHVSEILTEEQYAEFQGLVSASRAGGNPIFMPPGTPEEIANIVRDAFNAAVQDEDFVEVMKTTYGGSDIRFYDSREIDELITANEAIMTEYNPTFQEVTERLYEKYVNG
ncbi:MAG: hypothetical protein OEQ47_12535 [Acidimicrobiia bacterium]|nr:hypothetical protein [Acidimicrobiia bacterium]